MAPGVKRYRSPLRDRQAQQTREKILRAARRRFLEQGYGATTLADIAHEAGVAEQTVRAVFRTKANLVEHLLRLAIRGSDDDRELQQREAFQGMLAEEDATALLVRLADLAAAVHARSWDIMEIVRGAASSDSAIAELHEQRRQARHANQQTVANRLQALGALPAHTSARTAADLLWLYTSPEIYRMLVIEQRWSAERYRTWFHDAAGAILA